MGLSKYLENKKKVSLADAKELVDRGGSVIWRPDPSIPEEEQYAVVIIDPEVRD